MSRLPIISAVLFGLAALLFSLAPLLFNRFALPSESGLIALLAVPPAVLWGYLTGRYLSRETDLGNLAHFGLAGFVTTVAAALTGTLVVALSFVYSAATSPPEPIHHTVEAVIGVLLYGLVFGVIASPFGIAVGFALRALARRLREPAV